LEEYILLFERFIEYLIPLREFNKRRS